MSVRTRCDRRPILENGLQLLNRGAMVVYYESIKREPKIRGIKKCRCDERLKLKQRNLRASHTLGPIFHEPPATAHTFQSQVATEKCTSRGFFFLLTFCCAFLFDLQDAREGTEARSENKVS